jgi:hypothetical protein
MPISARALCLSGGGIASADVFYWSSIRRWRDSDWLRNFTSPHHGFPAARLHRQLVVRLVDTPHRFRSGANESSQGKKMTSRRARDPSACAPTSQLIEPVARSVGDFLTLISTFLRNLLINWAILIRC